MQILMPPSCLAIDMTLLVGRRINLVSSYPQLQNRHLPSCLESTDGRQLFKPC